ncbi:zinc finger protein 653 [Ascaphus truei]|uniref:zinc finger protein 653 n=2 Tax=Ascaphus truei TaxID=8439 RepID=UPI003F595590
MAAPVPIPGSDEEDEPGRKARGRPRLTDTDRARRRLESRKKYDVRRVYLGEAHRAWVRRRERGGGEAWSDARLAAYLLGLERPGKPSDNIQGSDQRKKRRRRCVNSLQSLVTWYQDHGSRCLHEPTLSELDTNHVLYATAVWQCHAGHRFFQDLRCPLKTLNHRGGDDGACSDASSSSSAAAERLPEIFIPYSGESPVHVPRPPPSESPGEAGARDADTVVCVPVQMSPGTAGLYTRVTEELGHVVATSVPSQVIIIAGPGYEELAAQGIRLDVTSMGEGEVGTCAALEAVSAYTQTEERSVGTVTEEESLYSLQREQGGETEAPGEELAPQPCDDNAALGLTGLEHVGDKDYRTDTEQRVPKEPDKRRSRRGRGPDADGMLQMFHCPFEGCTQVYTTLSSSQNHTNLVHRKGKTKVCPEPGCEKRFYLSNHLRRHMLIHTDVREFICETCGKSFKRKNHLEVHRRTHTGETPLQCEVCGYQCKQRASLNWHMKKHTSDVGFSFSCETCGKLFEKSDSVKFHKLKSHPEGRAT